MKRIIFGLMLTIIGLIFSGFCFVYAAVNPWDYNGVSGLMGSFLGTNLLIPFIVSMVIMIVGLILLWFESYIKK